jgi:dinuclear metal center YbgI/SA1388 family protein
MASRDAIVQLLNQVLRIDEIKDSSCNGLQVEGAEEVYRVGLAVDACIEAYEKAAASGCQMLITHHGLIWGGITSVTGRIQRHLRYLLTHNINLYSVHLPLDKHEEHGNNITLARLLDLQDVKPFGQYHGETIGYQGTLARPATAHEIAARLSNRLGGSPLVLPHGSATIQSIGIVSGGASDMIDQAAAAKLDCYITGEPVHYAFQLSRELAINVIYLGHYHSEQLGVISLGNLLKQRFGLECLLLDLQALSACGTTK